MRINERIVFFSSLVPDSRSGSCSSAWLWIGRDSNNNNNNNNRKRFCFIGLVMPTWNAWLWSSCVNQFGSCEFLRFHSFASTLIGCGFPKKKKSNSKFRTKWIIYNGTGYHHSHYSEFKTNECDAIVNRHHHIRH